MTSIPFALRLSKGEGAGFWQPATLSFVFSLLLSPTPLFAHAYLVKSVPAAARRALSCPGKNPALVQRAFGIPLLIPDLERGRRQNRRNRQSRSQCWRCQATHGRTQCPPGRPIRGQIPRAFRRRPRRAGSVSLYRQAMTDLAAVVRFVHLTAAILLAGSFSFVLLIARPALLTGKDFAKRITRLLSRSPHHRPPRRFHRSPAFDTVTGGRSRSTESSSSLCRRIFVPVI